MDSPVEGGEVSDRVKWGLIAVLVVAWAIHMMIPFFVHDYKAPPEAHVAFMTVIGILAAQKSNSGGDSSP